MNYFKMGLLFLFSTQIVMANNLKTIDCYNSSPTKYELSIEVDKFETLPPLSEVNLKFKNRIIASQNATKKINNNLDFIKFNFENNQVFDFLRVNTQLENAVIIYNKPKFGFIVINFDKCDIDHGY